MHPRVLLRLIVRLSTLFSVRSFVCSLLASNRSRIQDVRSDQVSDLKSG